MSTVILNNIPFQPDMAALRQRLRIPDGSRDADRLESLTRDAQAIAKPKVLYRVARVESKGDDHVIIEGVRFDSRVLCVTLEGMHWVFPHIVTCGLELHEWAHSIDDVMKRFWADTITTMALRTANEALTAHLNEHHHPGQTSYISPGVFPEWPLRQQRPLFQLLGDPQAAIGVHLLKSCWMVPTRSTSGIVFPAEEDFVICQLCATETCSGRRIPYDDSLYDRKYRLSSSECARQALHEV